MRAPTTYWLGTVGPGEGESKATIATRLRIDRRQFQRFMQARSVVEGTTRRGTIDLVRFNARSVLSHVDAIDRHIESVSNVDSNFGDLYFDLQVRVANWLAAWRIYRDHCRARFHRGSTQRQRIEAAQRQEFDENAAYRFAEKLRDYVTHVGLPPVRMSVRAWLDEHDQEHRSRRYDFDPEELLEAWDDWRAAVTRDLRAGGVYSLEGVINGSMASAEKLERLMLELEAPARRRAARSILRACDKMSFYVGDANLLRVETRADGPPAVAPVRLPCELARLLLA